MNLAHPIADLIPGARGVVVETLAKTDGALTGNQIAVLSGGRVSQSSVSRVVHDLARSGIVTARPAGSAILYELNRRHVAAQTITSAVSMRSELLDRIAQAVARWRQPAQAVWLFGSAARNETREDSDIDLLAVFADESHDDLRQEQLVELSGSVHEWSGDRCEILHYAADDLAALVTTGDGFIDSLRRDAVVLFGEHPSDLLRRRPMARR